jgi:O-antigen/teichoic acid export membrane protein
MTGDDQKIPVSRMTGTTGIGTSRPKGVMSNAGWTGLLTLWSGVISLLLTPLMIHHLGVPQYGILLLIWSFTGMLGLVNLGLGEATLRYVAYHIGDGDLSGVNRVFGSTISFYTVICIAVSVILFSFAPVFVAFLNIPAEEHHLVGWLLRLSALAFSLGLFTRAFESIPMAFQRYDISSKINIGQSVVRSTGYVLLIISNFGILHLVLWDVVTCFGTLFVDVAVIRRLYPGIRLFPSFSFRGLREIVGYSVYSFLGFVFYTMFRESGKLVLARYLGSSPVAYLGTPDNVSQRVHSLVVNGSETLLPRFSANRDPGGARALFLSGTWGALVFSIVIFIPIIVMMPDFLSLWINPKFSMESAAVGQLMALSYISQCAFWPASTFFRGTGKPWVVTAVCFFAGVGTLLACVLLVPSHGVLGVGYAYLLGSLVFFIGMLFGWYYIFGKSSMTTLMRSVGLPLLLAGAAFTLGMAIRGLFTQVNWFGLFALGGLLVGLTALLVLAADCALGGNSLSKQFLERIGGSKKVRQLQTYMPSRRVR